MELTELLETVGNKIKTKRKSLGMTQKEMSNHGLGHRHIQDIESGRGNLTLKTLWKVSKIFGMRVDDLLREGGAPKLCDTPEGALHRVISHLPVGCIIWQVSKHGDRFVYRFKQCNELAESMTLGGLSAREGETILEVFPDVEKLGFLRYFDTAMELKKAVRLDELGYGDRSMKFGHFDLTAIPLCQSELVVLFNDVTDRVLAQQKNMIDGKIVVLE